MKIESGQEWYPMFGIGYGTEVEVTEEEETRIVAAYEEFWEVQALLDLKIYGEPKPEKVRGPITIGKNRTGRGFN